MNIVAAPGGNMMDTFRSLLQHGNNLAFTS